MLASISAPRPPYHTVSLAVMSMVAIRNTITVPRCILADMLLTNRLMYAGKIVPQSHTIVLILLPIAATLVAKCL